MGMSTLRFLLLDGLGVLLTVPASIYIGKLFADQIDKLEATMKDLHLILAFIALSLVVILAVRFWRNARQRRLKRRAERVQAEGSPETGDPTPPGTSAD